MKKSKRMGNIPVFPIFFCAFFHKYFLLFLYICTKIRLQVEESGRKWGQMVLDGIKVAYNGYR